MGSDIYDRGERIKELKQQSDKIRDDTLKMYNDPKKSTSEILESWEKKIRLKIKLKDWRKLIKLKKILKKILIWMIIEIPMVHLMFTNLKELGF